MSIRNGDKARTNSQNRKRNRQRMKDRTLRAASAGKSAAPAEKKSAKRGA